MKIDMGDQTSDPVQDAGLASPPIQGIDSGVAISGDTVHVPITNSPQAPQVQSPPIQTPEPTQPSDTDPSAGGIITRPLTSPTAGYVETPVDQPSTSSATEQPYPGTPTDASGDSSSDLA